MSKHLLIKALREQNLDTKLFCVGDDWQSIFRFAGSDIALMADFEKYYGHTQQNQLVVTNRFNNGIALVSNKFILKNPHQIRKEVVSKKLYAGNALTVVYRQKDENNDAILSKLLHTLNEKHVSAGDNASVFLLGRYRHNRPEHLSEYKRRFKNLSIDFLTVHSSKGSEADYVIVLDVTSGKYGFPLRSNG